MLRLIMCGAYLAYGTFRMVLGLIDLAHGQTHSADIHALWAVACAAMACVVLLGDKK